jgi:integrative and conjugative element protein (TIGR02256 family)
MWRRRSPVDIFITESALAQIASECGKFDSRETGGILIGYHYEDSITISHVTGPGPRALHAPDHLELDLSFISKQLKKYEKSLPVGYEGNWHSHPGQRFIRPSRVDEALQRDIIRSDDYDIDTVLLLIVPESPIHLSDFHCFVFSSRWESYRKAKPKKCVDPF